VAQPRNSRAGGDALHIHGQQDVSEHLMCVQQMVDVRPRVMLARIARAVRKDRRAVFSVGEITQMHLRRRL